MVETKGEGLLTEITGEAAQFIRQSGAGDGILLMYLRHTSASLTIQENADPDVQADLVTALIGWPPQDGPWVHDVEGPDDMPAHVKAMLNGVSLHIPVRGGKLALGTWQGIYLVEHRAQAAQPRSDVAVHRQPEIKTPRIAGRSGKKRAAVVRRRLLC